MKNGKTLTLKQKQTIQGCGLNVDNWLVYKAVGTQLHLVHRLTGTKRVIPAV
ncbi:DUF6906 family protein [Paenibacillus gansuensis]|uniref:DUF6906 family protein n=1 Tax=Paenibacillus gansuensis TaxID=306542 RepID=A0ABW5PHH4_9BACL